MKPRTDKFKGNRYLKSRGRMVDIGDSAKPVYKRENEYKKEAAGRL